MSISCKLGLNALMYLSPHDHGLIIASFPGLPRFFVLRFALYNTRKRKSSEKRGRPGNTYHVNDVQWTRGGRGGGGGGGGTVDLMNVWGPGYRWRA